MGGGILSGVTWGTLTSVVVLTGASVVIPVRPEASGIGAVGSGDTERESQEDQLARQLAELNAKLQAEQGEQKVVGLEAPAEESLPEMPGAVAVESDLAEIDSELMPPPGSGFARAGEDENPARPQADAATEMPEAFALSDAEVSEAVVPDTAPPSAPVAESELVAALSALEEKAGHDVLPSVAGEDAPVETAEVSPLEAETARGSAPEITNTPQVPTTTPEAVSTEEVVSAARNEVKAATALAGDSVPAVEGSAIAAVVGGAEPAENSPKEALARVSGASATALGKAPETAANSGGISVEAEALAPSESTEIVTGRAVEAPATRVKDNAEQLAEAAPAQSDSPSGKVVITDVEQPAAASPSNEAVEQSRRKRAATATDSAPEAEPSATPPSAEPPAIRQIKESEPSTNTPRRIFTGSNEGASEVGKRVMPLTERNKGASRLPSIGDNLQVEKEEEKPEAAPKPIAKGTDEGLSGVGKRVVPLTERNKGAARLPVIGDNLKMEEEEESSELAPGQSQLSAIAANSVPFENPENKPLFSVVLIDVGDLGLDREVLTTFAFPVTFAIDPSAPDAFQAAKTYREAGFEVLMLPSGLPDGAQPQDLETTMQAYFDKLPQAVGILDAPSAGIQGNAALTRQLLDIAGDTGHGLVFFDQGLNAAYRSAERESLPSALVYRQLDEGKEKSPVIERYLNRAVFRAGQEKAVVMVGHTYAETVTALFSWAAGPKGAEVAMAPVSAVLRK